MFSPISVGTEGIAYNALLKSFGGIPFAASYSPASSISGWRNGKFTLRCLVSFTGRLIDTGFEGHNGK
ncbi:hypothetical protein SUGI_0734860 [Cryptomeria japonica]|nr:hypothetical protein SUGI_0734860 [Cryptomeria japonica]